METVRHLLEQSPMLAIFAAIGLGYAIGRISVAGFSLDIGAVLFAGLALGAIAPAAAPPALVGSIGFVMFLYGIGIQYGRQFFAGLRGDGLKWNALGAAGVLCSLAVAVGASVAFDVSPAHALGMFAGALTSTPTLQAAIDAVGNRTPAIGYSVAYPVGVIGPILCIFVFSRMVQARLAPAPAPPTTVEVVLSADRQGVTVGEVIAGLPSGVRLVAVRHGLTNTLPAPLIRLDAGDVLLLFGEPGAIDEARRRLGRAESGRLASDRSALDIARFFVSRAVLTGVPIRELPFPDGVAASVVEVRRGDTALLADPDLVLEFGDRVAVIAARQHMAGLRKHFGDSIKSTTEVSYISVGLGMSLGVLLGLIQFPIPGIGSVSMGVAGGPLVVGARPGQVGPDRSAGVASSAAGESHAAHVRSDVVPGVGGSRFWRALCARRWRVMGSHTLRSPLASFSRRWRSRSLWGSTCSGWQPTICWAWSPASPETPPSWCMPTRRSRAIASTRRMRQFFRP